MFGVANNLNNYIKTNKIIRNAGMSASFLLFVFALLASFPIVPHTDIVEAASPLESETKIAMSIGKGSANLSLIPKDTSGTFASSSSGDLAEFNVTTNNYTGYTLGIKATDDTGLLTNTDASTNNTLSSIPSIIDGATFDTSAYDNQWGYKPSKYNSVDNVAFHPAPTTDGSILDVTDSASSTNGNTYTIGLGARVDHTKPAGTYSNTFVLIAVGNPVAYTLNYLDNTGDTSVSNMPATNSGTTAATKIQIASNIPTRTGYTFAGWCDQAPTVNANGSTTCGGSVYQASTTETPVYYSFINQTLQNSIGNVYAMWNIASYLQTVQVRYQTATGGWGSYSTYSACTKNVNYGQTHSCSIAATTEYQAASLASYTVYGTNTKQIDVYRNTRTVSLTKGTGISAVSVTGTGVASGSGAASATIYYGGAVTISASLASGYDWVNWTGSATYTNQSQAISSVTSNLSFTANGKTSYPAMQTYTKAQCQSGAASGNVTVTDSRDNNTYTVRYINDNCWMTQNLRFTGTSINSSTTNIDTTKTLSYGDLTSGNSYTEPRIHNSGNATTGVWYNYCAASAGTICTDSNTTEASYSLCPAGWRLPTYSEQQGIKSYTSAFSPVTGGYYYGGSLLNTDDGYWWSSTAFNGTNRYYLSTYGSGLYTDYYGRRFGLYVRCVRAS